MGGGYTQEYCICKTVYIKEKLHVCSKSGLWHATLIVQTTMKVLEDVDVDVDVEGSAKMCKNKVQYKRLETGMQQ